LVNTAIYTQELIHVSLFLEQNVMYLLLSKSFASCYLMNYSYRWHNDSSCITTCNKESIFRADRPTNFLHCICIINTLVCSLFSKCYSLSLDNFQHNLATTKTPLIFSQNITKYRMCYLLMQQNWMSVTLCLKHGFMLPLPFKFFLA